MEFLVNIMITFRRPQVKAQRRLEAIQARVPFVSMLTLIGLVFLSLGCLLGGAVMLAMIPIRAFDYPQCARCKHNLSGLANPRRCPECGFELIHGGIIKPGNNRKRHAMITGGILLIACPLFLVSVVLIGLARAIF